MKNEHWITKAKRRKFLLVLPLLVIPFFTMAFWALGGGKDENDLKQNQTEGLNFQLPNAQLKEEKGENKLSYYEHAERDSARWREGMQKDPFFPASPKDSILGKGFAYDPYPFHAGDYKDPNEQKIYQKLNELNHQLQYPVIPARNPQDEMLPPTLTAKPPINPVAVNRMDSMMNSAGTAAANDPEVEQLNGVMDKILAIQHPERIKENLVVQDSKNKQPVYAVTGTMNGYSVSLLDTNKTDDHPNEFFTIGNENSEEQNAIQAVIHETQTLADGAIVKMRLLEDIQVDGIIISKGSFVFGKASLQGERLLVEINSMRRSNSIFNVILKAYDEDGLEGIYVPGIISNDVARQTAGNALQSIEFTSVDPSLKAQAASTGMNAAKNLFSKKAKLARITIKAGYRILLKSF